MAYPKTGYVAKQHWGETIKASGSKRVLDLGCGEGKLIRGLLKDKQFEEIVGMDVSYRTLEVAADRLHLETLPPKQEERIRLIQGSLGGSLPPTARRRSNMWPYQSAYFLQFP
jgi:methylase of polypeptide subunit release factors